MQGTPLWTVYVGGNLRHVSERNLLLDRVAERLHVPRPSIHGNVVAFPSSVERVRAALDETDPEWWRSGVLVPPPDTETG
jgi:hypothetical protein